MKKLTRKQKEKLVDRVESALEQTIEKLNHIKDAVEQLETDAFEINENLQDIIEDEEA